ncbi:MAG: OmpA family protein, partial [Alteraurantiacibacter sp.]
PAPTDSAPPVASIIRDDASPDTQDAEVPVKPVELVLPFPNGSDISATVERRLVGVMKQRAIDEDWPVILAGHTDSGGNDQANMRASRARAEAVAAWLVERGVDDDRIEVIAFGEQNPIAPNALPDGTANEEGRRSNRRVEIRIAPPEAETVDTDDENAESDQDA